MERRLKKSQGTAKGVMKYKSQIVHKDRDIYKAKKENSELEKQNRGLLAQIEELRSQASKQAARPARIQSALPP